jgi:outer membrane lipoprotein SlyB
MTSSSPSIEMPSIEEIKKLVTFTRISGKWRVNTVSGNVEGDVWGNVEGNVMGNVEGNVEGDVRGNVRGDVEGNVEGNVMGTINGRTWLYELTLKERIQDAIKAGDTDLASELLEGAEVTAKD